MFTVGDLSHEDQGTGVIFSFLNQLQQLATRFDYPKFLFAWDSRESYRRKVYPDYKHREPPDPKMQKLLDICKPQFPIIRTSVLPFLGFANNFLQFGLEADDIIAMIVTKNKGSDFTIVSSDNDLYQLLSPVVRMYDIKNKIIYDQEKFIKEWRVAPYLWNRVKSIAGCDGDKVIGLPGIGYKTAIKYLRGELTGNKLKLIEVNGKFIKSIAELVVLPHPKTQPVDIQKDKLHFDGFENLCLEYGFRSFLKKGAYEKWQKILK
jgi:5'-3' exonuclease